MAELDDTSFFISILLLLTDDEVGRERIIANVCEKGHDREKVEIILDELHKMFRKDPLDVSKLDPKVRMAFARRIAKISGKTVEQVLAESDALGKQGRLLF